jgi:hypothetical protein
MFYLLIAGGLLIWGQTILEPRLGKGLGFILYWFVCFLFTALAILTALLDLWIVRTRARVEKKRLLRQSGIGAEPPPCVGKQAPEDKEKRSVG